MNLHSEVNTNTQNKYILPSIQSLLKVMQNDNTIDNNINKYNQKEEQEDKVHNSDKSLKQSPLLMSKTVSEISSDEIISLNNVSNINKDDNGLVKKKTKKKTRNNLPKHVIDVLNEWLEAHLDNPYPTSLEKKELIAKTSLSNVQLSNWFINVRRRKLYSQYYDLKDKTDSASIIKKKKIHSINDSGVSRKRQSSIISIGNQNDNSSTNSSININKNTDNGKTALKEEKNNDDKTSNVEQQNSNVKLSTNSNSNNESDYLFTKRRMSLQHILNDFPSETLPKPQQQQIQNKQSYIEKNRERKENNNNNENNNSDEPPTPRIITEADEMKLEAKFKFQPFIRRKKLMDRLYDLKKIYYVADNEAGPEPLPETDSDE